MLYGMIDIVCDLAAAEAAGSRPETAPQYV